MPQSEQTRYKCPVIINVQRSGIKSAVFFCIKVLQWWIAVIGILQRVHSWILVLYLTSALNIKHGTAPNTHSYFQQRTHQLDINYATFLTFSSHRALRKVFRIHCFTASLLPAVLWEQLQSNNHTQHWAVVVHEVQSTIALFCRVLTVHLRFGQWCTFLCFLYPLQPPHPHPEGFESPLQVCLSSPKNLCYTLTSSKPPRWSPNAQCMQCVHRPKLCRQSQVWVKWAPLFFLLFLLKTMKITTTFTGSSDSSRCVWALLPSSWWW